MKTNKTKTGGHHQHRRLTLFRAIALAAALTALPASAATWTVVSTADDGSPGTLREALDNALDGDTIDLTGVGGTILPYGVLFVRTSVTITGPGADQLAVDGGGTVGPLFVTVPGTTVIISGLTMSHGYYQDSGYTSTGGAIYNIQANLTLNSCALIGNGAGYGGAICNDSDNLFGHFLGVGDQSAGKASLTINNCILSGNSAGLGGAVANIGDLGSATLSISQSTLSRNSAGFGGGIFIGGLGGSGTENLIISSSTLSENSAYLGGAISTITLGAGTVTTALINSTLSANSAVSGDGQGSGGAIANFLFPDSGGNALLTLDNCTISSNSADGQGGGVFNGGGTVETRNTLFNTGSQGQNLFNTEGTIASYGYNLSNDDGGGFLNQTGDQISQDAMLGPLQDNGGPTFTHALLIGSPAIDAGASTDIAGNPVIVDQRGVARPAGFGNDIGAFEAPGVVFSSFDASKLRIWLGPPASFQLQSSFTLGAESDGINPLTESATLQIGTLTLALPAGSFQLNKKGDAAFSGVVDGVSFSLKLQYVGGSDWVLKANASNADMLGTVNPVTVSLSVGDDEGVWSGDVPIN